MAFLGVLKNDFRCLVRCLNNKNHIYTKWNRTVYTKSADFSSEEETFPTLPKPITNKTIVRLKKFDQISQDYDLIYRAQKTFSYTLTHCCLLLTTVSSPPMLTYIVYGSNFTFPIVQNGIVIIYNIPQFGMMVGICYLMFYMMYIIVSRFPFRLYRNKNMVDYIATFPYFFCPWKMQKFHFKKGDVKTQKVPKVLPFQIGNFNVKNKRVIMIEDFFIRPLELEYMITSDKPK